MYDLVSKRFWFFAISMVLVVVGIVFLVTSFTTSFGVKLGIEFNPGTELRINFTQNVSLNDLRSEVATLGYPESTITIETPVAGGQSDFVIRTGVLTQDQQTALLNGLTDKFGANTPLGFNSTDPTTSKSTINITIIAIIVAAFAMWIYIIWAFRHMPHPLRYGVCAIIALLHDVIVAAGIFALIGAFLGWQIDLLFVAGILTILGYSINNTIVVFDRIRENIKLGISTNFEVVVNDSIIASMGRCLNTSFATGLGLLVLLLIVGPTIENFVVVLLIGLIAGTFDSICIAPNLLVLWQNHEWGRLIGMKAKASA